MGAGGSGWRALSIAGLVLGVAALVLGAGIAMLSASQALNSLRSTPPSAPPQAINAATTRTVTVYTTVRSTGLDAEEYRAWLREKLIVVSFYLDRLADALEASGNGSGRADAIVRAIAIKLEMEETYRRCLRVEPPEEYREAHQRLLKMLGHYIEAAGLSIDGVSRGDGSLLRRAELLIAEAEGDRLALILLLKGSLSS
jgi:hypothetical protein